MVQLAIRFLFELERSCLGALLTQSTIVGLMTFGLRRRHIGRKDAGLVPSKCIAVLESLAPLSEMISRE